MKVDAFTRECRSVARQVVAVTTDGDGDTAELARQRAMSYCQAVRRQEHGVQHSRLELPWAAASCRVPSTASSEEVRRRTDRDQRIDVGNSASPTVKGVQSKSQSRSPPRASRISTWLSAVKV